jgi:hypothetical protein
MAKAAKAKNKKRAKRTDKAQSERFRELARELGADGTIDKLTEAFKAVAKKLR